MSSSVTDRARTQRRAALVGGIGSLLGVVIGVGVIVRVASGEAPVIALVDGAIVVACCLLGMWAAASATSAPRRASTVFLAAAIVGFFVLGLVWIVAAVPLTIAAFAMRRSVFG